MGDFLQNGDTELPATKSDTRPAHVPPNADEWSADDANKLRSALLDLRSGMIVEAGDQATEDAAFAAGAKIVVRTDILQASVAFTDVFDRQALDTVRWFPFTSNTATNAVTAYYVADNNVTGEATITNVDPIQVGLAAFKAQFDIVQDTDTGAGGNAHTVAKLLKGSTPSDAAAANNANAAIFIYKGAVAGTWGVTWVKTVGGGVAATWATGNGTGVTIPCRLEIEADYAQVRVTIYDGLNFTNVRSQTNWQLLSELVSGAHYYLGMGCTPAGSNGKQTVYFSRFSRSA